MLLDDIAGYLENRNLCTFSAVGGDVFMESLPDSPDECVLICSSGGLQSDSGLGYDNPGVRIIVRGTCDPRAARERTQGIYDALHGFHSAQFVAAGNWVVSCLCTNSGPVHAGRDESGRHLYSLDFRLRVKNDRRI